MVEGVLDGLWSVPALGRAAGMAAARDMQPSAILLDAGMGDLQRWRRAAPSAVIVAEAEGADRVPGELAGLRGVMAEAALEGAEQDRRVRRGRSSVGGGSIRRHLH